MCLDGGSGQGFGGTQGLRRAVTSLRPEDREDVGARVRVERRHGRTEAGHDTRLGETRFGVEEVTDGSKTPVEGPVGRGVRTLVGTVPHKTPEPVWSPTSEVPQEVPGVRDSLKDPFSRVNRKTSRRDSQRTVFNE